MASITKEAIKREFLLVEDFTVKNFCLALHNATKFREDVSAADVINEWGRINNTIENECINNIIESCIYLTIYLKLKKIGAPADHLNGVKSKIAETWNRLEDPTTDIAGF